MCSQNFNASDTSDNGVPIKSVALRYKCAEQINFTKLPETQI